jgi:LysR family transcriptional regulator, transcriptional activator for dmlA
LARNQRVLVAAPRHIEQNGSPPDTLALQQHACLVLRENSNAVGRLFKAWKLKKQTANEFVRVNGPLCSNSGELVRDWCLEGRGIMLRSLWDIAPQLATGQLVRVLPDWCMPDADIEWLAPYRPDAPRRTRLLIDFLIAEFAVEPWKAKPAISRPLPAPPGLRR